MELTKVERDVVDAAALGEQCDLDGGDDERTIRASLIRKLCVETEWPVHPRGVRISGARVHGSLDLDSAPLRCPVSFVECTFDRPLSFDQVELPRLEIVDCIVPGIRAVRLKCRGEIRLAGTVIDGEVCLADAVIDGRLDCQGTKIESSSGLALLADKLSCRGDVVLDEATIKGQVSFVEATVGGSLSCEAATLERVYGIGARSLCADGVRCGGNLILRKLRATGEVSAVAASIDGSVLCEGAVFADPQPAAPLSSGNALTLDRLVCGGDLSLREASLKGQARLVEAIIDGELDLRHVSIENSAGMALALTGIVVRGLFRWFPDSRIRGEVSLAGAHVGTVLLAWPGVWTPVGSEEPGGLDTSGFRYDLVTPVDRAYLGFWLQRVQFSPCAYEYLACVLQTHGLKRAARTILADKLRDRLKRGADGRPKKAWIRLLGMATGYGLQPLRALAWLLVVWLAGAGAFAWLGSQGLMSVVDVGQAWPQTIPTVSVLDWSDAVTCSLGALVPGADWHLQPHWIVTGWPRFLLPVYTACGWSLLALALLSFVGWIPKLVPDPDDRVAYDRLIESAVKGRRAQAAPSVVPPAP